MLCATCVHGYPRVAHPLSLSVVCISCVQYVPFASHAGHTESKIQVREREREHEAAHMSTRVRIASCGNARAVLRRRGAHVHPLIALSLGRRGEEGTVTHVVPPHTSACAARAVEAHTGQAPVG